MGKLYQPPKQLEPTYEGLEVLKMADDLYKDNDYEGLKILHYLVLEEKKRYVLVVARALHELLIVYRDSLRFHGYDKQK